jgi:hypothetical protein
MINLDIYDLDWLDEYNRSLNKVENEYSLTDIRKENISDDENYYWNRIIRLSAFEKNNVENGYDFPYEIEALSSQILFGTKNCLVFYSLRGEIGYPNQYTHRYSFFVESTVHAVYAYFNRFAVMVNFNFCKPLPKRKIYFNQNLVDKLKAEFKEIEKTKPFAYIVEILSKLNSLNRNEMVHNNSFIMQEYFSSNYQGKCIDFREINKLLIYFNNTIAKDINLLCDFLEYLENNRQIEI